ncbi:MAG TPA: hypothetical protein DER68_00780 [Ruminococcaceae bacterium]|mgnify:FL=1|nr:hypothetical protein [Oscillospiraceae bacterium]
MKGTVVMTKDAAKKIPAKKTEKVEKPVEKTVKAPVKTAAKPAAAKKTAAKKAPTKVEKPAVKAAKKPKVVGVDEMCKKLEKLVNKEKASAVKTNVAVDVKVWGWADEIDRHFYIEIKNGKLAISPYEYNAASFEAYISYENILRFLNGKLTLKDAIATGALNANGNIPAALLLGNIF